MTEKVPTTETFGNYLLKGMVEIDRPADIPWSFDAPGWWVLGGLLLLAMVAGTVGGVRWWRRNRYRRENLAALRQLKAADDVEQVPLVLRRTALAGYPRDRITALTGTRWIDFLNATAGRDIFSANVGAFILQLSYGGPGARATDMSAELFSSAEVWIKHHRREISDD